MIGRAAFAVGALLLVVAGANGDDVALLPGLIAEYRSEVDPAAVLARIDAKPAFSLGVSSPHPRMPPGPFVVRWRGLFLFNEPGPVRFSASVCGEVTILLDGNKVLSARGDRENTESKVGSEIRKPPGVYPLEIQFRALKDRPARLQIQWQGAGFAKEPVPAWLMKHAHGDVSDALRSEKRIEDGRQAIEAFGCARCHAGAFPSITAPAPGPSLADAGQRLSRDWIVQWLGDPARLRPDGHMPALFASDRTGFVERWLVAGHLAGSPRAERPKAGGDHRPGRVQYISLGCVACHFMPDLPADRQPNLARTALTGLGDRFAESELAAFLGNPTARYPDGRMPHVQLAQPTARDIAAFLLLWSKPVDQKTDVSPPSAEEIQAAGRRLKTTDPGAALIREKRCAECHPGIGPTTPSDLPIAVVDGSRGCVTGWTLPRFQFDVSTQQAIIEYQKVAGREVHRSPFAERQRQLDRAGCVRCHQRDSDQLSPLESAAATLGGSGLETVPFQRVPRLTAPLWKYTSRHLEAAVREGVSGLRPPRYTYRMPAFGPHAAELVQALAEADGDQPTGPDAALTAVGDATAGSLHGPTLVSSQGYACVSCHVWNGRMLAEQDPGSTGPDLLRVPGRIRRDWFDRYLESPSRAHPGTPMPVIFPRGEPATIRAVLDGDSQRQKDALWSYFSLGKQAPSPAPAPPMPIVAASAETPLIAQAPFRLSKGTVVEGLAVLTHDADLLLYDLESGTLRNAYVGASILRSVQGRLRTNTISGTLVAEYAPETPIRLRNGGNSVAPLRSQFLGYERTANGCRIRRRLEFESAAVELEESIEIGPAKMERRVGHGLHFRGLPAGAVVTFATRDPVAEIQAAVGEAQGRVVDGVTIVELKPNQGGTVQATVTHALPAVRRAEAPAVALRSRDDSVGGSLVRPGYRAIAYPRPQTVNGDDLIMPGALAVHPKDGRVFVASLKSGAIHVLRDPNDNGRDARFEDYAGGLFQDCLAMRCESDGLYVLHRRGFTKIANDDPSGRARSFDRLATLTQGITDSYDYAYGLVRDRTGAFVYSYAPYADTKIAGAGGALRWIPGKPPEEVAFGFRNPLGWCTNAEREVFFTDNQGEWVATNKLCHLDAGRFYGFPNPAQPQHRTKPPGRAVVWIPYSWAHSINGVTCDTTDGKFGPFAGQFFLAELVFGGGIIRADLERINGEYQGACFPFWGRGLLGPLNLAFDPRGRLFVGSITEPGWMAQPDRGALYRIDHTGEVPFEIKTLRIRPDGFRIEFTRPATPASARDPKSYRVESWRYEYTGAYGSPEYDRAASPIERIEVADDGRSANLIMKPPVKDRVYLIRAGGVRSPAGEGLVHDSGAYTVNEAPAR